MSGQPLSRRQVLGGLAGASALAAFPLAAQAQEPVAFSIPRDSEVLSAYDVQQVNGYTKITMDHVRPNADGSGVLDVQAIRMDLDMEARRNGTPTPIIITDYAYDGPEEMYTETAQLTDYQDELFDKVLPLAAQRSQRPIVHLRVSAYGAENDELALLHSGALLADLENNRLGPNGTYTSVPGDIALPYYNIKLDGNVLHDAAFSWYDRTAVEIQQKLAAKLLTVVDQQNETLTAGLDL